jgi:hypothetical protein
MVITKEERNRILHMLETGQVTALEAGQLLDTLEAEFTVDLPNEHRRERTLRVRASNVKTRQQRIYATATVPLSIIRAGLRVGAQFLPQMQTSTLDDLLHAIERGANGRLLDVQDLDKGERIEVFVD